MKPSHAQTTTITSLVAGLGALTRASVVAASLLAPIICAAAMPEGHAAIRRHVRIPAQGLGPALQTLARHHGIRLVYVSNEINGRHTRGAAGNLTPEEALRRLLDGTGLTFRYLDEKTVAILPAPASALAEPVVTGPSAPSAGSSAAAPAPRAEARSASDIEEVIVPGLRDNLRQAFEIERSASSIVDVITIEDLGASLEKNAAESLAQLPGVNVDRRFGQGEHIGIRGTDPALNRTLLNGQTVASADWFILDSPGRTFNYTLLAPQMFSSIEVYKSPQASLDEGSIGGTVILRTRRPLELPADTLRITLGYAYNDRAEAGAPDYSALYSWRNDSGTLGVLLTALHAQERLSRHGIEILGYSEMIDPGLEPAPADDDPARAFADDSPVFVANSIDSALFEQARQRTSVTFNSQLSLSDSFELSLTGLYVDADYDNYNQSRAIGTFLDFTQVTVRDSVVVGAEVASGVTSLEAVSRRSNVETHAVDLRADWSGGQWSASATAGTTAAAGGTQQESFLIWGGFGGYSYELGKERAAVRFADDPLNPDSLPLFGFGQSLQQPTHDAEQYLQADLARELGWGLLERWRAGAKYREHETSQAARRASILDGPSFSSFVGGATPGNLLSGIDAGSSLRNWLVVDRGTLEQFVSSAPLYDPATRIPVSDLPPAPEAAFNVQEDVASGYAQLDLDGAGLRGNVGLRYVRTELTSSGAIFQGELMPGSLSTDYADLLPSLNLAFDIPADIVLRVSASRTIARPSFADLSSFLRLFDTLAGGGQLGNSGEGGNPQLDPYRSSNLDVAAEWYPGQDGLLALTLFYKDVRSFIVRQAADEQHLNILTGQVETYSVSRPRNAAGGEIRGSELTYQNTLWGSFGLQANYTYADGGTDNGLQIPFNSKHTLNVSPYFDNGRLSARITYGWRSRYLREIGRNGVAVTTGEYRQLDAALGVELTDEIELTAQALNLLDETHHEYAGSENRPLGLYKNGRRYFLGVRFAL